MKSALRLPHHRGTCFSIEPLEARIAPATIVSLSGGNLSVLGDSGAAGTETLSFVLSGGNLVISDSGGQAVTASGAGVNQGTGTSVSVVFASITGDFTLDTGVGGSGGPDTVDFDSALSLLGEFTANVGGALHFNQSLTLAANHHLMATTSGAMTVSGTGSALTTSGTGGITLTGSTGVALSVGSSLNVVDGGISVTAAAGGVGLNGAVVTTSGIGNIHLQGTGNVSVQLSNGAQLLSTATGLGANQGLVTVSGTGAGNSPGLLISGGSLVRSADGAISLTGLSTAAGAGTSLGIRLEDSVVQSTGTAGISMLGRGSAGLNGGGHHGISVSGASALITSVSGAISLDGQTGFGRGGDSFGIVVINGAGITATGSADVNFVGVSPLTSGAGSNSDGIVISGTGSRVISMTGAISLTGSGADEANSKGVVITAAGELSSTSGNINVTGTVRNGGSNAAGAGILYDSATPLATSGTITLLSGTNTGARMIFANGSISGTAGVVLRAADGVPIDLGSTQNSTGLELSAAELGLINTSGTLAIGQAGAGPISVSAAITRGSDFSLTSGSGVTLNQAVTLAANKHLSIDAGTLGTVTVGAGLTTSGSGSVQVIAKDAVGAGSIASDGGLTFNIGGQASSLSGTLSGTSALTKLGAGKLALSGTSTFSGGTDIVAGALEVRSATALGTGGATVLTGASIAFDAGGSNLSIATAVTFGGNGAGGLGAIQSRGGDVTLSGGLVLSSASHVDVATLGNRLVFAGSVSDGGNGFGFTKSGPGTLVLQSNNSTFAGALVVGDGVLSVATDAALGDVTNAISLAGGALESTGTFTTARAISIAAGVGGGIFATSGNTLTLNGNLSGSGLLKVSRGGTVVLASANSFTGDVMVDSLGGTISNTTLRLSHAGALTSGTVTLSPGTVFGGHGTALELAGVGISNVGLTMNATAAGSLRSALIGSGNSAVWNGPVTLAGDGANQFFAGLGGGGSLVVNGAISADPSAGFIGTLDLRGSGTGTVNGVISAPNATVFKADDSTWTINSVGSWGGTRVGVGTLKIGANNVLPVGGTLTVGLGDSSNSAAAFDLNGFDQTVGGLAHDVGFSGQKSITNSSATRASLTVDNTSPAFFGTGTLAIISGNISLVKTGAGTLVLGGANTFLGEVRLSGGTLQIASDGALGNSGNTVSFDTATLHTTASFSSGRHFIRNAGGTATIDIDGETTLALSGLFDGPGTFVQAGTGTLVLGVVQTVSNGTITVDGNRLTVKGAGQIEVITIPDGMGGQIIDTITLSNTDVTTNFAIKLPLRGSPITINKIISLDPTAVIGSITLGRGVTLGDGVADNVPDLYIRGRVDKLKLYDLAANTLIRLGDGLSYDAPGDLAPDTYNHHPNLTIHTINGPGVVIDVTGDGTPGDLGGVGGGGLGKVIIDSWAFPGAIRTTQSITSLKVRHGDFTGDLEVDRYGFGTLTQANVGAISIPTGSWGSTGCFIEGTVGTFNAAAFLAGATLNAGAMAKLKLNGDYAGTITLTDPSASSMKTFTVKSNFSGSVFSSGSVRNIKVKGVFSGTLVADSIGSLTAFDFVGTTSGDTVYGDSTRQNIVATNGSLGTIKTSAGGVKDYEIIVKTVFSGFGIKNLKSVGDRAGLDDVLVRAGAMGNINVAMKALSGTVTGIRDSIIVSTGSIGMVVASDTVIGSVIAAGDSLSSISIGSTSVAANLTDSLVLAGVNLGADATFGGAGLDADILSRAGRIASITVTGMVSTTSIAAGVDPGPGGIFGDGNDTAAPGLAPSGSARAIGAIKIGASSGILTDAPLGSHQFAIEASSITSLTVGNASAVNAFVNARFLKIGGSESASDILMQLV